MLLDRRFHLFFLFIRHAASNHDTIFKTEYDFYARHKLAVSILKFHAWWQMYLVEYLKPGRQLERSFSIKSSRNLSVLKQKHIQIQLIQNNRIYHRNRTEGSFAKRIAFKIERCCWFYLLLLVGFGTTPEQLGRSDPSQQPTTPVPERAFNFINTTPCIHLFFYLSFWYAIHPQIIALIFKHSQMNEVKE